MTQVEETLLCWGYECRKVWNPQKLKSDWKWYKDGKRISFEKAKDEVKGKPSASDLQQFFLKRIGEKMEVGDWGVCEIESLWGGNTCLSLRDETGFSFCISLGTAYELYQNKKRPAATGRE